MQRAITGAIAALIATLSLSVPAVADTKPEDVIKFRKAVMQSMAGNIGALLLIASNKVEGGDYLQAHADGLASASMELDILFPDGSDVGDTDTLAEVWVDTDGFAAAIMKSQETSAELVEAVSSGNRGAIMGAFSALGKSCKGCHEHYRAEDDDSDSH